MGRKKYAGGAGQSQPAATYEKRVQPVGKVSGILLIVFGSLGTWFGRLVGADFADFFSVYRAPASARYFLNCSASDFYFVADTFMERAFQQKRI